MNPLKRIGSALYKGWMAFARLLMLVNTTIILTIVYVVLIGPSWLVMRLRGRDLLDRSVQNAKSYWKVKETVSHTLEHSKHQF